MKKKILCLVVFITVLFLVIFMNRHDKVSNDLNVVKVAEVTHSAFYTPFYVAIEKGYFEEEGIKIDLILTSGANNVTAAVISGDVHVGFCGPEATMYVYDNGEKDYLVSFAGLTKRDGQFIVSREKIDNFTLDSLKGKEVLAGRRGGMPIVNFYNALEKENVTGVNVNDSVDFANLTSAFVGGTGDFVNLFEPNATKLEKMGYGYVYDSVGKYSGEVPYTAFNAKRSYVSANKDIIEGFRKAIDKGLVYTFNNSAEVIAKDILSQFPDTSLDDLTSIIDRYKRADSYLNSSFISGKSYDNLTDMLIKNKMISERLPYSTLIVNE